MRRRDLHPHQVHIAAEGETEKIVCERVLEALAGMPLKDTGVSVQRLFGVGNATLQQETLQALKAFPRYLILIAHNEGDMKRQVERLQEEGVLTDETRFSGTPASRRELHRRGVGRDDRRHRRGPRRHPDARRRDVAHPL